MPSAAEKLATIETIVKRLDLHLIGEDGNGGVIRELKAADQANEKAIAARHAENQKAMQKLRNTVMITAACTVIVVVSFLTGNGAAGIENVLKILAK